jgi:archaemetzincin
MPRCDHSTLYFEASCCATEVGYRRPTLQERARATLHANGRGCSGQKITSGPISFPPPLVLPGDDLSLDPSCPPQSVREWLREGDRNELTPRNNVIYVLPPPGVQACVDFVSTWTSAQQEAEAVAYPDIQNVLEYLKAFYHGLRVELLTSPKLSFTDWDTERPKSRANSLSPRFIGLDTTAECIRIRTRLSPDGIFKRQLNLDDLLDAAIGILPDDAYALLLLVQHDLYENADDIFTCGRAYGGSSVAVISTARYDPNLDNRQNVEREHAWPASHCKAYVEAMCAQEVSPARRPKKRLKVQKVNAAKSTSRSSPLDCDPSALQAAVSAYKATFFTNPTHSPTALAALWLARVCRTASHELGHCFGIDHCVYYACVMQGSASLAEDARQPLYLCPIDLAKLRHATGADVIERYSALLAFCEQHEEGAIFIAFAAWLRARVGEPVEEMEGTLL